MMINLIKKILYSCGFALRRKAYPLRTYGEFIEDAARIGFEPRTVFDIGVADGTFALYEGFPKAKHVLVEPLVEYEASLKGIAQKYDVIYFMAATGNQSGTMSISVANDKRKSSVLRTHALANFREVPVITIDDLCSVHQFPKPYFLKIDVEGAELLVMQGAKKALQDTEVVILEVSCGYKAHSEPGFAEVVSQMKKYGFVVYDIVGAANNRGVGGLKHVDLVFVKENGFFITNQRQA